jgi:hypothetical protein
VGSTSAEVVRAHFVALLVRAAGAAEVLLPEALAQDLLPGLEVSIAIRRMATVEQAASALEYERIPRPRRLDGAKEWKTRDVSF